METRIISIKSDPNLGPQEETLFQVPATSDGTPILSNRDHEMMEVAKLPRGWALPPYLRHGPERW